MIPVLYPCGNLIANFQYLQSLPHAIQDLRFRGIFRIFLCLFNRSNPILHLDYCKHLF